MIIRHIKGDEMSARAFIFANNDGKCKSELGAVTVVQSFHKEAVGGWPKSRVSNLLK